MKTTDNWLTIKEKLIQVYGSVAAEKIIQELKKIAEPFLDKKPAKPIEEKINEKDTALIVYANSIIDRSGKKKPLEVLLDFISHFKLNQVFTVVHLLPFYPWDTDRGFSVVDYYQVNPEYGSWQDIKKLSKKVKLMFDLVLNHASVENPLVQKALIERHLDQNDPRYCEYESYKDFVIAYSDEEKPSEEVLKKLARPRPNPVLTPYLVYEDKLGKLKAILGTKLSLKDQSVKVLGQGYVWTTFSRPKNKDGSEATRQVDLNYANPRVFLEAVKIIVFYLQKGARLIRLDAAGYLWKELGTPSIHHQKTHLILQTIRAFFEIIAPELVFVAEVNESQDKVFEYLGKKDVESDLVYQFTNFILIIYSLYYENSQLYSQWYQTTKTSQGRQFITVLGSHDGANIKPLRGFLTNEQIEEFAQKIVKDHQLLVNFGFLPGGKKIIYELCSTPWQLINGDQYPGELAYRRYLLVLALGLMVKGLPAIYLNGLIGAKNYFPKNGLDENRTVNRQIFDQKEIFQLLKTDFHQQIFNSVLKMLKIKSQLKYFSPWESWPEVESINNNQVLKFSFKEKNKLKFLALYNFSSVSQVVKVKPITAIEKITEKKIKNQTKLSLLPFEFVWLEVVNN